MRFLSKQAVRSTLSRWRLGRWLLIGFYTTYLDQFARVMQATDNYNLRGGNRRASLRFRLHRSIHRLEKSLSLHPRRSGAGRENILELMGLMAQWHVLVPDEHPTFTWAQNTVATYLQTLDADIDAAPAEQREKLLALRRELAERWGPLSAIPCNGQVKTPLRWSELTPAADAAAFARLLDARKSVRRWTDQPVPRAAIERAMADALRAPSACNRQPFGVVALENRQAIRQAAALLTGGGGFADQAPLLLALTSDFGAYGGHEQRNLAYIDGGLAAMAFLLSLTAQGFATVPMNWSVSVKRDCAMRRLLGLGPTQVILFFVGVGTAHPEALIPASIRRPAGETLVWME